MGLLDQQRPMSFSGKRTATPYQGITAMDAARFVAEATPIIGDAMAAKEVYDELQKPDPNYAMVAALGGAALVGLVPGLGDAMASGIKKGARGLLDTAKRIEVDPNALGMSGGNIRLKPKSSIQDAIQLKYPEVSVDLFGDSEKGYELSKIVVPKGSREQGTGTKVMEDILSLVDAQGARVSLTPDSAFGGSKPRLKKFYKKFGFVDNKGVNKDFTTRNTMYRNPVMPTSSLPSPRNEAEAIAKQVLELRASGNARDVTEKMMNAADDQYMFKNTPIPMDAASRKARATDDNFVPALHGTGDDISAVDASFFGSGQDLLGSGFYTTTGPARADRYVPREKTPSTQVSKEYAEGGNILPLMVREDRPFILEDAVGDSAKEIADIYSQDPYFDVREMSSGVRTISTDDGGSVMLDPYQQKHHALQNMRGAYGASLTSDVLSDAGYSGVSGPEALGNRVRVAYKPEDVRSQFARFDPEFKHLKNLTAAGLLAPGVLASMQEYKKQQELERGLLSY